MVVDWFGQTYIPNNTSLVYETDLFVGYRPDIDNAISLFEEQGVREDYMNEYGSDSVGMLVYGRGSYSFLDTNMRAIENQIDNLTNQNVGSGYYMKHCSQDIGIQQVDIDKDGRHVWTMHFLILVNNSNTVHRQTL